MFVGWGQRDSCHLRTILWPCGRWFHLGVNIRLVRNAPIDVTYGKGLLLGFTVEDPVFFTVPWRAQITYQRSVEQWQENICAESTIDYYGGKQPLLPTATKPDF